MLSGAEPYSRCNLKVQRWEQSLASDPNCVHISAQDLPLFLLNSVDCTQRILQYSFPNSCRISDLNTYDLEYLYRLVKYLNKEYTRNFFLFIEKNKCIDCFSKIKYNEFIMVDDRLLHIIEAQIHLLKQ